jgi:methylenetetrahydromethanopterin dehydrogenase
VPIVTSAHEMMRMAADLCDQARELEKGTDVVLRKAHKKDGVQVSKTKLVAKFD